MKLERLHTEPFIVDRIRMSLKANETRSFLLCSDVHFDSKKCDRELLTRHFKQAQEKNAGVIIVGDFFDAMGTKKDPRSLPNDIRPEYYQAETSYLDAVVEDANKFLTPYKDNILLISKGNHEGAIERHNETNPLYILSYLLNKEKGDEVLFGEYEGVVHFFFERYKGNRQSQTLYYHHGYGGNAKRSKGVLNVDIDSANYPFADIIAKGHIHQSWQVTRPHWVQIPKTLQIEYREQEHICLGTYKRTQTKDGWSVQKGMNPTPIGSWWIDFTMDNRTVRKTIYRAT